MGALPRKYGTALYYSFVGAKKPYFQPWVFRSQNPTTNERARAATLSASFCKAENEHVSS
jgi:hypothetical protein